jgi:acylphosphatase
VALIGMHVYVSGRVQGVYYRYATAEEASKMGLTGWVKNLHDGRVEACFEGEEELINKMVLWCQQGPPMARVTNIETYKKEYTGEFKDFTIRG